MIRKPCCKPYMDGWLSYMPYHDEAQLLRQKEALEYLPIENSYGEIAFIYTKNICDMERYLEKISKEAYANNSNEARVAEAFYSSKIEGASLTFQRALEICEDSPINDAKRFDELMVKRGFEAIKQLNESSDKLDETQICEVWSTLTKDCRENEDIQGKQYRNKDVGITNSDFEAVLPENIPSAMKKLCLFINGDILEDCPFVKAIIIHYAFETIHPFCDGNGRMGRLLMRDYLIKRGIENCQAISFSEQIDKNKAAYYAAFTKSENAYGDCTPFIEYMLEMMAGAYQ